MGRVVFGTLCCVAENVGAILLMVGQIAGPLRCGDWNGCVCRLHDRRRPNLDPPVSLAGSMWPVTHAVSGQNLTHRSTMELVCARQVPDGVTSQVGSYQTRLFGCVEPVLDLLWDLSRTVAFGVVEEQSPRLVANSCGAPRFPFCVSTSASRFERASTCSTPLWKSPRSCWYERLALDR